MRCLKTGMIAVSYTHLDVYKRQIMTDRKGTIYEGREGLNPIKEEMAKITNANHEKGSLSEVIKGADVFIGVSAPGTLTPDMVRTMAKDPIIFACANPTPEIFPDEAKAAGAAVVSTGRSDYPNQVNNVLCFPGIFRGALDAVSYTHLDVYKRQDGKEAWQASRKPSGCRAR